MNRRIQRWLVRKAILHFLKESGMSGFLSKFFSMDSIVSRLVRGILLAFTTATASGKLDWKTFILSVGSFLAGMIGAGQNNSAASGVTNANFKADVKAVPKTS